MHLDIRTDQLDSAVQPLEVLGGVEPVPAPSRRLSPSATVRAISSAIRGQSAFGRSCPMPASPTKRDPGIALAIARPPLGRWLR